MYTSTSQGLASVPLHLCASQGAPALELFEKTKPIWRPAKLINPWKYANVTHSGPNPITVFVTRTYELWSWAPGCSCKIFLPIFVLTFCLIQRILIVRMRFSFWEDFASCLLCSIAKFLCWMLITKFWISCCLQCLTRRRLTTWERGAM